MSRYIGPFEVLERVGIVSYRLALLSSLSSVQDIFYVSMLRKYTPDSTHIMDWGELVVDIDGTFEEGPGFVAQDCESSEGVMAASRSGGGNMEA